MSPPLTGHRDDCSGAQRASWHPVLSLLSQSLSHPSFPFCLLFRQALMHAYIIIGLGKAQRAGIKGGDVHRERFSGWGSQIASSNTPGVTFRHILYIVKSGIQNRPARNDINQIMTDLVECGMWNYINLSLWLPPANTYVCLQANEYSLPSLNTGLEDVKPSLSTSASSDLASSVSQSYSVVTGTIWLMLQWSLKEYTQLQHANNSYKLGLKTQT